MRNSLLFISFVICIGLHSCEEKCQLNCSCFPTIETNGYSSYELDTVIIRTFLPDSTFSNEIDSFIIAATKQPWWRGINDTTKKVYRFSYGTGPNGRSGYNLIDYIANNKYTPDRYYDFEVYIPSNTRVYKISGLTLAGPTTNTIDCKGGSYPENTPCNSAQYISSYILDGTLIIFPANQNFDFIYLSK